jgi:uncharacterized membrane protein YfcA
MLAVLFVVALLAGALNALAGGGSFLALPALLWAGVPAVAANATTTFAMWPASVASAVAYRRDIRIEGAWVLPLGAASLAGGFLGGLLLMRTPDTSFMRLLPWLMLLASLTFTFGHRLTPLAARGRSHPLAPWTLLLLQLAIATYGGYFGGGMGIMMLAAMAIAGMTNIHEMNALKVMLAIAINGVALAEFLLRGAVVWTPGLVMASGGITGGYAGAGIARRLPQPQVRLFVIAIAWILTAYFFVAPYVER